MVSSISGVVRFGFIEQTPALERVASIDMMRIFGMLLTHSQCVWPWKRRHRVIRRLMRIMAFRALEFVGFTEISVPIPSGLAMGSVLPIAIDWAMTLCTKHLYLVIPNGSPTAKSEFVAIIVVMAVQA